MRYTKATVQAAARKRVKHKPSYSEPHQIVTTATCPNCKARFSVPHRSGERTCLDYYTEFRPHNTAIKRKGPSVPARHLVNYGWVLSNDSVLDYGCGRGADAEYYKKHCFYAAGYDPHAEFGYNCCEGPFDVVTVTYVLNVVAAKSERIRVLQGAAAMAKDTATGLVIVSTRSPEGVARARKPSWVKAGDGYMTSKSRGTFQRGIGPDELTKLGHRAGLETVAVLSVGKDTACVVFKKK